MTSSVYFILIIIQAYSALKSLNDLFMISSYKSHQMYCILKIMQISTSFLKILFSNILKANTSYDHFFLIDLIWMILDIYFVYIIYRFASRVKTGEYMMLRSRIYPNIETSSQRIRLVEGIIKEAKGIKVKNDKNVQIELSFPANFEKKKYIKVVFMLYK